MKPWYAHYDPGVPKEAPRPKPLPQALEETATRFPNRVALEFLGRSLTYQELWREVQAFAKGLQAAGVQPGERVAIMLPNSPQFVIAFYGTLLAGGVGVNVNPMYTPRELRHQLQDAGAKALVILDQLLPRYQEVKGEAPVALVVRTGIQDYLPFPKNLLYPLMLKRKGQWPREVEGLPWRSFLQRGRPKPVPLDLDDLACCSTPGAPRGSPRGPCSPTGTSPAMLSRSRLGPPTSGKARKWSWAPSPSSTFTA